MKKELLDLMFSIHYNTKFGGAKSYIAKINQLTVDKICKECLVLPSCSKSLECPDYTKKILPIVKKYLSDQNRQIKKRNRRI